MSFSWPVGKKRNLIALGLCAALALIIGWDLTTYLSDSQSLPEPPVEDFRTARYILPQPPLNEFPIKTVREAWKEVKPEELVLGVTIGNESRAYPLDVLNDQPDHKVLNDTLGGRPIAATFCDNCHNGIIYSRDIDGQTLTFAVEGRLWKESMVMYDLETNTRWSHMTGVAKTGPLKGKTMTPLPSIMTDWQSWRSQHPDGTIVIMPHAREEFVRSFYANLKEFVLGVADGSKAKSWSLDELSHTPVLNDDWNGTPVLVVLDRASVTARLYWRTVGARLLTFQEDKGKLIDQETGTSWDLMTGRAETGPLAGQCLEAVAGATLSKREAWKLHHPN